MWAFSIHNYLSTMSLYIRHLNLGIACCGANFKLFLQHNSLHLDTMLMITLTDDPTNVSKGRHLLVVVS